MNRIFQTALAFFFLYDYYFVVGGRVFDYIALALLFAWLLATYSRETTILTLYRVKSFYGLNYIFWIVFGLIGILQGNIITVGAFFVGIFLIFPLFYKWGFASPKAVRAVVRFLIIANLVVFFFQFLVYKATGFVISFHSFPGLIPPRVFNEDLDFFRAAGLYQEPSTYTIAMFLLIILWAFITKKAFNILCVLGLMSLLLSESLWGMGAMVVYIIVFSRSLLFKLSFIGGIVAVLLVIISNPFITNGIISSVSLYRIANFQDDPSTSLRLGVGNESSFSFLSQLFGHGLSINNFQATGGNGLNFYTMSFGYFGLIAFFISFFSTLKRKYFIVAITIGYMMTGYPMFTYMVWWAWIGLVFSTLNNEELWS